MLIKLLRPTMWSTELDSKVWVQLSWALSWSQKMFYKHDPRWHKEDLKTEERRCYLREDQKLYLATAYTQISYDHQLNTVTQLLHYHVFCNILLMEWFKCTGIFFHLKKLNTTLNIQTKNKILASTDMCLLWYEHLLYWSSIVL